MKILFYEQNDCIDEGRLLASLFDLGLNIETFADFTSDFPFLNLPQFITVPQLLHYAMQISIQEERLPLAQVGSWLTDSAAAQSFSAKISKVFALLDTAAGERTSGLSRRELFTLLAITHGLDLLNIGSLGFALLPLSSTRNDQKSQAATVYRQQQPAIYAPHSPNAEITWLANALLTALSETPQTSFRFLQIFTCPQSGEQPLEVVLGELTLANDKAMVRLQTNIDDMSPQLLNHAINQLFAASQQLTMDELNHKILLQLDPIPGRKK